jgi:hypothetical protein
MYQWWPALSSDEGERPKEEEDQQLQGQINKEIDSSVKLGSDLTS